MVEPESGARWSIRTKIGEKAKVIHKHKTEGKMMINESRKEKRSKIDEIK